LQAARVAEDLPVVRPLFQHRIWDGMDSGDDLERLARVIADVGRGDDRFHTDGGRWMNNIPWAAGHDDVLIPMEHASSHERVLAGEVPSSDPSYPNALFHLLASEINCCRYWGDGVWMACGAALARRTTEIAAHDL
jgi:hypothetical protein